MNASIVPDLRERRSYCSTPFGNGLTSVPRLLQINFAALTQDAATAAEFRRVKGPPQVTDLQRSLWSQGGRGDRFDRQ